MAKDLFTVALALVLVGPLVAAEEFASISIDDGVLVVNAPGTVLLTYVPRLCFSS